VHAHYHRLLSEFAETYADESTHLVTQTLQAQPRHISAICLAVCLCFYCPPLTRRAGCPLSGEIGVCRYVRSLVSAQLGGKNKAPSTLGTCAPQQYVNGQEGQINPLTGLEFEDSAAVDPCGLMPYSYFNDSYSVTQVQPGGTAEAVPLDVSPILCHIYCTNPISSCEFSLSVLHTVCSLLQKLQVSISRQASLERPEMVFLQSTAVARLTELVVVCCRLPTLPGHQTRTACMGITSPPILTLCHSSEAEASSMALT